MTVRLVLTANIFNIRPISKDFTNLEIGNVLDQISQQSVVYWLYPFKGEVTINV